MTRKERARRLGKVRARAGRGPLRAVSTIQVWRPDVDAARQEAVLTELERTARAERAVLGLPAGVLVTVGIGEDGVGVAAAAGRRWRVDAGASA